MYFWCCVAKEYSVFLRCSRSILLVWFAKGSVFVWFVFFNLVWLHSGLPSGILGLDVALGLSVSQYKLFVWFSLTLNSFKFCFKLFVFLTDINNWLFRRNNRLLFCVLLYNCLSSWLTWFLFWIYTKNFI